MLGGWSGGLNISAVLESFPLEVSGHMSLLTSSQKEDVLSTHRENVIKKHGAGRCGFGL